MCLVLGATLALYDYMRVGRDLRASGHAGPLADRVAAGRRSLLFAHHGDYAAATIADHPGAVIACVRRASHYLLDARLMQAWATALHERGELDKARHVAARLKEFRHPQSAEFFAPCDPSPSGRAPVDGVATSPRGGGTVVPVHGADPAADLRGLQVASAAQSPDLPPRFSSTRTAPMTMPRSTALHMS